MRPPRHPGPLVQREESREGTSERCLPGRSLVPACIHLTARSFPRRIDCSRLEVASRGTIGASPTPPPTRFEASVGEAPLSWIAAAAASATQSELAQITRRGRARTLFLALSRHVGWQSPSLVAERCNLTDRAVRKAWTLPPPAGLEAALLCLGDARLRA